MFNIINHQRNANLNHNEISPHTCQNDCLKTMNTFYRGCGEKGTLLHCCRVCLVTQSCPTLCDPMDCSPSGSSVHGNSPSKNTIVIAMPSSRGSSQPRDRTWVSCTAGRLPSEPPGKPKNTGVGSLSFLQGNFPSQESKCRDLLHCR